MDCTLQKTGIDESEDEDYDDSDSESACCHSVDAWIPDPEKYGTIEPMTSYTLPERPTEIATQTTGFLEEDEVSDVSDA